MKKKTKSIFLSIIAVILLVGMIGGAAALWGGNTRRISPLVFSVGGIDVEGKYVESKTSIYTPNLIECQGLVVEPDFKATGSYQVFYYGSDKNFISATEIMDARDTVYTKGDSEPDAMYCRIMITPETPLDDNGKPEFDFNIKFYEAAEYARAYKIIVNKKQNFGDSEKLTIDNYATEKALVVDDDSGILAETSQVGSGIAFVCVEGYRSIEINYPANATEGLCDAAFCSVNGNIGNVDNISEVNCISAVDCNGSLNTRTFDVPNGSEYFIFTYKLGQEFTIFGIK